MRIRGVNIPAAGGKIPQPPRLVPFPRFPFFFLFIFPVFISCAGRIPVAFWVQNPELRLYGLSREAAEGLLALSKPKTCRYVLDRPLALSSGSLKIEYSFSAPLGEELKKNYQLIWETERGTSWVLPWDAACIFPGERGEISSYSVPLGPSGLEGFSLSLAPREGTQQKFVPRTNEAPRLIVQALGLEKPWYGFIREGEGNVRATPFVYKDADAEGDLVIAVPPRWRRAGGAELRVFRQAAVPAGLVLETTGQNMGGEQTGGRRFEIAPGIEFFRIPPELLGDRAEDRLSLRGEGVLTFYLAAAERPPFPEALSADPGLILEYPREAWRDPRYEIFRWERFPSILIIDTADYGVQDSLFKRLCFFTEKKGFRGRVAADREIAELHGWNAHDYRAEDLARFFQAAADFPLSPEERELEQILFAEGIIRREAGGIRSGEGALLSISRESTAYLRSLFMVHEGFHGLFFIDEDFRDFCRRRWAGLSRQARNFILSYFDYQNYDTGDEYLVINELMAHCLQQPVSQVSRYFGETLASRINASPWRRQVLPEKDEAAGSWPELGRAFRIEAEAFSEYVHTRWGLSAGRVWDIQVRY
jgi:hypothetical protein